MNFTGGEAVVEMLKGFGVEIMFGLPGDQTDVYDALYRRSEIRHVLVRHEQAAAHMADAYARATGKVGVCDAAVGPGATNLIGGIAEAFTSGIAVIAIVSEIRTDWQGRGSFQEIDQVAVFGPITKAAYSVDDVARIPALMAEAFRIATTGRPGPVLLSFPLNVLKAEHEFAASDFAVDDRYGGFPAERPVASQPEIAAAVDTLLAAERPLIVSGGGTIASGASAEVLALAERLGAPIATTFMGKGTVPENDPLSLGPFGLLGRPATNDYLLHADLALALGTRFTNVDTAAWTIPAADTQIIHVDIDAAQLGRNYAVAHGLQGDVRSTVRAMLDELDAREATKHPQSQKSDVAALTAQWRAARGVESPSAQVDGPSAIHPLQIVSALRAAMSDAHVLVCDSGYNQIWGGQYFEVRQAGRSYMGPRGFGIMGFSLPAAISQSLADPERGVVALCGDGGFAMVIQELETAVRVGANITVCIMNNSSLHFIKDNQRTLFDGRYVSTDFSPLDYASIATAFGCVGIRVESSDELESAFETALASPGPAVIDVVTRGDVVPDRISMQKRV